MDHGPQDLKESDKTSDLACTLEQTYNILSNWTFICNSLLLSEIEYFFLLTSIFMYFVINSRFLSFDDLTIEFIVFLLTDL